MSMPPSIDRTGTPHSTESASGEPTSELLSSLLSQQQQQAMAHAAMSKAEHEAIFGRASSTPASASPGGGRSVIVAHEDEDDAFRYPGHGPQRHHPQYPPGAIHAHHHHWAAIPNHNMIATGRSPRLQASQHPPSLAQNQSHAAAPTALMIMRRRRSNSTTGNSDSTHGRKDELGNSNGSKSNSNASGSLNGSRHRSGSLGSRHRSPGLGPKTSPKDKQDSVPNDDPLTYNASIQQQQQQQAYPGMAMNPQHPQHLTAMRYNSSLHSTLGGYPMGAPTQLTHPSVTMELIARDRARWEADYYSGYGMDYGMDYGYDYYGGTGPGLRNGNVNAGMNRAELERFYQPRINRPMNAQQAQQQQLQQQQQHRIQQLQQLQQQQIQLQQQQQHQQQLQQDGELRQASTPSPAPAPSSSPELDLTPNSKRVFQERDYKTDRVWREDDHTSTTSLRPERRNTDKMSNTGNDKTDRRESEQQDDKAEDAPLPPIPQVGSGETGQPGQPTIRAQGPPMGPTQMQQQQQQPELQAGLQQPQLPQGMMPLGSGRLSEYDAMSYHSAMGAPPQYYQVPPSTPVRTPERTPADSARVRQISDLSAISGPAVPVYPNGVAPIAHHHPHYQGLIYPPTPGSMGPLPPQLAGMYQAQQDPRRGWMDPYQQAQPGMPQHLQVKYPEDNKGGYLRTTHEDRVHTPAPSMRDLTASAPPQLQGDNLPKPLGTNGSKRVSFSNLEIRTYETILGDNPSCSGGPSVGLGWRYDPAHTTATVDEYEAYLARIYGTEPNGEPRTIPPEDLVLHRCEREAILLNTGYTRQDMADSVRAINKVKNKRRQTVHNLPVAFLEERAEAVRRTFRRWVLKKGRTRAMYEEWKKSCNEGGSR